MIKVDTIQSITSDSLSCVIGGDGNAAACFDHVLSWGGMGAAGGAVAGIAGGTPLSVGLGALGGGIAGGGGAYLDSPDCGDGTRSPMQMMRESTTSWGRGDTSFNYMGEQTP
jgi:hypothetical protein